MKRLLAPVLLVLLALPLGAAAPSDPLAFVPADATAVGMVRLADLRSSPYGAHLFSEADHVTLDGDGARFLEEAHLKPSEDVDTIVFAGTPGQDGKSGSGIAVFEGRFDSPSVESALIARGATKQSVTGGSFLLLPEKDAHGDGAPGAIAFLGRHLAVVGPQASVEAALARGAGSSGADFRTGSGLGRHLRRVSTDASAWAIVDLSRGPWHDKKINVHGEMSNGGSSQLVQIAGVMKQVPYLTMSATLKSDSLKLAAFGACDDAETRGLLEDSLRGLLAAWRLSAQDSKPDLVPVLRSFKVEQSRDGVSLTGSVPGQALEAFLEHKGHH